MDLITVLVSDAPGRLNVRIWLLKTLTLHDFDADGYFGLGPAVDFDEGKYHTTAASSKFIPTLFSL
jgi:hypothetical protein